MAEDLDPKITRRYRELGDEEPPRELDQAIVAAAHRGADGAHAPLVAPGGRHRWYFAFAAAAILVLAVAVTVQVERQQPDPEAVAATQPSAASDRKEEFSYYRDASPPAVEEPKKPKRAEPKPAPAQSSQPESR